MMIDVDAAVERFEKKLDSGFFVRDRSHNTSDDYDEAMAERDTKAIEQFGKSKLFQELIESVQG